MATPPTLNPEALDRLGSLRQLLSSFNSVKLQVEYTMQLLQAKSLIPNSDGTPPDGLAVDASGFVGGEGVSTIVYADYAGAMSGLAALVAALESTVPGGSSTVEDALLRFSKGL